MFAQPLAVMPGFDVWPGFLDVAAQRDLVQAVFAAAEQTPFAHYRTASGKAMSVAMTALGPLGWTSDAAGYRYADRHPGTDRPWPPMPASLMDLWRRLGDADTAPDSCLVNLYCGAARMGLHQDRDEADPRFPVLSVSLGDTAVFRIGGVNRKDPTRSLKLTSGDVLRLSGPARMAFHGVDRVIAGSSSLVPGGGRINLTLRRAGAG
ncbi:alpha-ketoglutarate-dependent dioxygenase AlkB [Caulobacter vibrioides]|uniref:alpha-ketoglutarate-dependent dioxygenase AlkB n=1 Tax=Caulobacter vibrioides TaxID=155892 RepID=UPI000BB46A7E|nr:alpha-ketoglutarate-dependent dioxygenase AlkB [Caulobacter vibrioides]ATC26655.1 alpha-ketoglutarate-dependent dioxygenase AlkB [Caulobacter vibrioides]PLR12489.1 alpha-ketoglutarate-dependent dioxygenase AlkB [Caulobacter vibrioides]